MIYIIIYYSRTNISVKSMISFCQFTLNLCEINNMQANYISFEFKLICLKCAESYSIVLIKIVSGID